MDALDAACAAAGAGAYVMFASSEEADLRYLTGFTIHDPVVFIKKRNEPPLLIVPQMEYARAVAESSCSVMTRADAGYFEIAKEEPDRWRALAAMIARVAGDSYLLPASTPFALGQALAAAGAVHLDSGTVAGMRSIKRPDEIAAIREVQRRTEAAMALAVGMIARAGVRDGVLMAGDETPLTSAAVRQEMHIALLRSGCRAADTIISCGEESAMPHRTGDGPLLAGQPIVIDVFPRSEKTGYYADMSRTVVKGEPSPEIREMYAAVGEAKRRAMAAIRPGVAGKELYQMVVDYFAECGYASGSSGFVHSLGHGVGLDVHEFPLLGPAGGELQAGHVVTVEPGLYFPGTGGVRLEDMGVVTVDGFDPFTRFSEVLVLE
ncbi:MAG: aminopeptidase P family protein [Methanomicrobiales archaeon]|nr:aminopeptidase P family protein [Methanomicrobiales archaeon]